MPAPEPIATAFTALVGTRYPVVQAGMSWASSCAELPLAVSEAGGLGVLAAGPMRVAHLAVARKAIATGTTRPWAVNVPLYGKLVDEVLSLLLEHPPPVIVASQGSPRRYLRDFQSLGTVCLHVVAGVEHARKAADLGVDGLVVVGGEAGGHPPPTLVSSLVQTRRIAQELSGLPIVSSGGFADGAGLAAGLSLGAAAVQFGTRFLASPQARIHTSYQQRVLEATAEDAVTVGRGLGMIRTLANEFTAQMVAAEESGVSDHERGRIFQASSLRAAAMDGDVDGGKVEAGQSAGLVRDVRDAGDIVREIAAEYHAVVKALPGR